MKAKKPGPMDIANNIAKMANDVEAKKRANKPSKAELIEPDEDDKKPAKKNPFKKA